MKKTKRKFIAFILVLQILITNIMPVMGSELEKSINNIAADSVVSQPLEDEILESLESESDEPELKEDLTEVETNETHKEEPSKFKDNLLEEISQDVIEKISITKDNVEIKDIEGYKPSVGDDIKLKFDFRLPTKHSYGENSKLIYKLPTVLKPVQGTGILINDSGIEYGSYSVVDGDVVLTFNDEIRFYGEGGSEGLETVGYFEIDARFELDENNLDYKQEIVLPGNETIILDFSPVGGDNITKSAEAENNGTASSYIKWILNANTLLEDLGEEGFTLTDTLSGNQRYDENSLKVTRYSLDSQGNRVEELDVTADYYGILSENNNSFSMNLTGKYAYEIEYKTIVGKTNENYQQLTNEAVFKSDRKRETVIIRYEDPIEKWVNQMGEEAIWTIKVNSGKEYLPAGIKIVDNWDSNNHSLVPGSFKINGSEDLESLGFRVYHKEQGFEVELTQGREDEFIITYVTRPNGYIYTQSDVTNTVYRSDKEDIKKSATAWYTQNVLYKLNTNIDYENKTMDWKVILNNAGYKMDYIEFKDTFVNNNLRLKEDSLKVLMDGKEVEYEITYEDGNAKGDKKGGFRLAIQGPIERPIFVTYTTYFETQGDSQTDKYKNLAVVSWQSDGDIYTSDEFESSAEVNEQQKNKGYKQGYYDYESKKFKWAVGINYNFEKIKNPEFKDIISDSQIIDEDSVVISKLDLSQGGVGNIKGDPLLKDIDYEVELNDRGNELTIKFKDEINRAYYIQYESKTRDDYYPPQYDLYRVVNKATLNNGEHGSWSKTVEIMHTNKLIVKGHEQEGKSAKLKWFLKLNWGQSSLNNVVIKDIVGKDKAGNPNQMVYKDSFKVYEMNFSTNSSVPVKGLVHTPGKKGEGLYYVEFNDVDGTFEIIFNEPIEKAYQIEYDTYFLGASGEKLENKAELYFQTKKQEEGMDNSKVELSNFKTSGYASNKKGQLEILKVDYEDNNKRLKGAAFELWSSPDGFLIERVENDIDGVYTFKTKVGRTQYYLKETRAPEGYSLDESEYKDFKAVSIDESLKQIVIENKKLVNAIKLVKVDAQNAKETLKGAKFLLYDAITNSQVEVKDLDGNIIKQPFVTNEKGEIILGNLKPGSYYFKEVESPKYYLLDKTNTNSKQFIISDNKSEDIIFKNTRGTGSIKINKTDWETNEALSNVVFSLRKKNQEPFEDGNLEILATTNEDGVIVFKDIPYDTYLLKEEKAKEGYVLDNTIREIVLDSEHNNFEYSIDVKNIRKDYVVKLTKYNEDKTKTLKGAEFEIRKEENGQYIKFDGVNEKELITDQNGLIALRELPVGKYQLVEIKAPSGYKVDKTPLEFEILKDQDFTIKLEMINLKVDIETPQEPDEPTYGERPQKPNRPNKPNNPTDPNNSPSEKPDEDIFIEIEDEEVPLGGTDITPGGNTETQINEKPTGNNIIKDELPKTGQSSRAKFYIIGMLLIVIGLFERKKAIKSIG